MGFRGHHCSRRADEDDPIPATVVVGRAARCQVLVCGPLSTPQVLHHHRHRYCCCPLQGFLLRRIVAAMLPLLLLLLLLLLAVVVLQLVRSRESLVAWRGMRASARQGRSILCLWCPPSLLEEED